MGIVSAEVKQYGGFIELSDILMLTAIDNNLVQATKLLGAQAGRTLDTITREVLSGGTNVQFAEGQVASRSMLKGGDAEGNHYLTVDAVRRAVRYLKKMNAETISGSIRGLKALGLDTGQVFQGLAHGFTLAWPCLANPVICPFQQLGFCQRRSFFVILPVIKTLEICQGHIHARGII
jgi:hypothetical protein